jgi:hypothetical protein
MHERRNRRRSRPRKRRSDVVGSAAVGAAAGRTKLGLEALEEAQKGARRLEDVARQWCNTTTEQCGGRSAEELLATEFNVDAANRGLPYRATTTGAHDAADVRVIDTSTGRTIAEAQVKCHRSPTRALFEASHPKHRGQQRIFPSDQVDSIKTKAARRGQHAFGYRDYPDTAKHASDKLSVRGAHGKPLAQSQPFTRARAHEAARNPKEVGERLISGQALDTIRNGAIAGGIASGCFSLATNIVAYTREQKTGAEVVADTAAATGKGVANGAAISGVSIVAKEGLKALGAKSLSNGSAPIAVAVAVVEIGKDAFRWANDDIDGNELAARAGGHVVKGGMAYAGGQVGAALGTAVLPGAGTVVGAIVGGLLGGLLGSRMPRRLPPALPGPSMPPALPA